MWILFSCAAPVPDATDDSAVAAAQDSAETVDTGAAIDTGPPGDTSPPSETDGWRGLLLDDPWGVPPFAATASDRTDRGPEHLQMRTALWFFRDGGSYG